MTSPRATALPSPGSSSPGTAVPSSAAPGAAPAHDIGLLLLRLALGLTMAAHGTQKLFGWFDGGGIDGTGQFFTSVGYPSGTAMAVVAGLAETFGGLALAAGLLTPLAGAALLGTLLNALAVRWGDGFFAPAGVEYELLLTAGAAALTLTGPGRLAADRFLPVLRSHRLAYGLAAVLVAVVAAGIILLVRD